MKDSSPSCWGRAWWLWFWHLGNAFLMCTTFSGVVVVHGKADDCDLYLAKSTIPNAGWGVFTARSYQMGEKIGNPTVGIPIYDISGAQRKVESYGVLKEFLWPSSDIGAFSEAMRVDLFLPGPASLINHHPALDNVIAGGLTLDGDLLRYTNPMAGSYSAYHQFTLIAKRDIEAGEELFTDKTRNLPKIDIGPILSTLPTVDHYKRADEIISGLLMMMDDSNDDGSGTMHLTEAQWVDILYRIQNEFMKGNKVNKILPKTLEELQRAKKVGSARFQLEERDLDWIQSNGLCMDNIREGKSAIENAGRGAFATRTISKGSIVSTSPMVHVMNHSTAFEVANAKLNGNATSQLLLNYCHGHRHSELLLCPTTEAALMNHNAKRANVKIRWAATKPGERTPYYAGSLEDLAVGRNHDLASYNTKLIFEYVALEDIKVGDELLLDYGSEWDEALTEHLERETSRDETNRVSAKVMNEEQRPPILSSEMTTSNSYMYECLVYPNVKISPTGNARNWEELSSNMAIHKSNWPAEFQAWYADNDFAPWYPCKVVKGDVAKGLYDVQMLVKPLDSKRVVQMLANPLDSFRVGRQYRNVPRDRIRFTEMPYHSDQHLPWSFRHYIPIDDAMFPLRWRDDYLTGDTLRLGNTPVVDGTNGLAEEYENRLREVDCGLYLAKSSIPNAGFGTYTAVDIPDGGILIGSKLPAVAAADTNISNYHWPGNNYRWSWELSKMDLWPNRTFSQLHGLFGSLANSHTGITNLQQEVDIYEPVLDRLRNPGAGAISDYVGSHFVSAYPIPAGEELFVTYGEHWFIARSEYKEVPLREQFEKADRILSSVSAMRLQNGASLRSKSVEMIMEFTRERIIDQSATRTLSALKAVQSADDLHRVIERNGTAHATVIPRSNEWLEENGFCLDHVYVNRSSNPQAGWGAFSRRHLKEGSTIIVAPMLATTRDFMDLNLTGLPIQQNQLFLNYNFGHKESSILFFPLNQAIAINHNSARTQSGQEPNARLRFSTKDRKTKYFWFKTLDEIKKQKSSTMVLEFIATRDISPDEEIFIDYGKAWEDAWNDHVKNWVNPCKGVSEPCYRSSKVVEEMNKDKMNKKYHKWSEDHMTVCKVSQNLLKQDLESYYIMRNESQNADDPRFTLSYEGIDYQHEGFNIPRVVLPGVGDSDKYYRCIIRDSKDDKFDVIYLVRNKEIPHNLVPPAAKDMDLVLRLRDLPMSDVLFRMKPLKSDMVAPGTFRHEIGIPDSIFPPLWKDMK